MRKIVNGCAEKGKFQMRSGFNQGHRQDHRDIANC